MLVIGTMWVAKRFFAAIRDWRDILRRLADSKKAKSRVRLTKILIQAVSGTPIIISHAWSLLAIGLIAILLASAASVISVSSYGSAASMSRKQAIGLGAIELLEKVADDPSKLSDNAKLTLEEGQKSSESKLRHATPILNVLAPP